MSETQTTAELVPFQYGDEPVRTVVIEGEPWFVLADLCKVLDLRNVADVRNRLADGVDLTYPIADSLGRTQQTTIISEAGMYEVVIRSDKPEAVTFRRWLTSEVLPAIRKTGSYSTAPALTPAEKMAQGLMAAQELLAAKDDRIAELEPKAELAEAYLTAQGGARLVREVAKTLGMKQVELRRFLLDEDLIFVKHAPCGDVMYDFRAQYAHQFLTRETVVNHTWGSCSHYTLQVLPRGVELIVKRLRAAGVLGGAA